MKRSLVLVVLCVLMTSWGAFGMPRVVATHSVLGEFAQVVGAGLVEVTTIIPSGFCPAHYDLAPSDLAAILEGEIILYSGLEPWLEELVATTKNAGTLLQLPGIWNTPEAASQKVVAIAGALGERFPENAHAFTENATVYVSELTAVGETLRERALVLDVASIPVICMEWQVSFVTWLGFDVAVTYGLPEELSLRDLVDLAAAGNEAGVQLVIDNLQSGVEFGAKLAREVGGVHVVLSNFPGALPRTATVSDLFVRNAEALFSAIEPIE